MMVYALRPTGLTEHLPKEVPDLLDEPDTVVWIDVPQCDEAAAAQLGQWFPFHTLALGDCMARNHISKFHFYGDHVFTVLHAPKLGTGGHVHYVELDQFIGADYLVTVHGPVNPVVDPEVAHADTDAVLRRILKGEIHPRTSWDLSASIVSSMVRRETQLVADLARESGRIEQQVTDDDHNDDPELLLEELFQVGHALLAVRTIATHSAETCRAVSRRGSGPVAGMAARAAELADRFEMVRTMADGQGDFVRGVIDFYQARTSTHLALATEGLAATSVRQNDDMRRISAWVAIVAAPTLITGFFGQNVPYPGSGQTSGFIASSLVIVVTAVVLYALFKTKRWL
jgi:Mg2+ and Co2+ transporter CorA